MFTGDRIELKNISVILLFMSLSFHSFVAGPIERSTHLLPQFFEKHDFDIEQAKAGIKLMLWGLFMKVAIADRLAFYVNDVYNNLESYTSGHYMVATYFFAYQIYCDFARILSYSNRSCESFGLQLDG